MTAMIADGFDNAILGIAERCGDDNVLRMTLPNVLRSL